MRDVVLGYLQHREFDKIIDVLRDNRTFNALLEDQIFKSVFFEYFTAELFDQENLPLSYPAFLLTCHDSVRYAFKLSDKDEEKVLSHLFENTKEVNYAKRLPHRQDAVDIVNQHLSEIKEKSEIGLKNAQKQQDLKVVEEYANNTHSIIKSIFNSPQEKEFYLACKYVFSSFLILPNTSLTSIFNQDVVKKRYPQILEFYLKSSVDMVIVDEETFIPTLFFELDSKSFHNKDSETRDSIKDKLFTELGHDLIRITKRTGKEGINEYISLLEQIKKEKNIL